MTFGVLGGGGLGKSAAAVYGLARGCTVKEIAAALGGKGADIRKQLRKLRDKGLADCDRKTALDTVESVKCFSDSA